MKAGPTLFAASLSVLLIGGCNGQLDHLGRPPSMTAPGTPPSEVPDIAQQRRAVPHTAPDQYQAPRPANASLWHSGPTSLFGDRRARTLGDILTVVIEINDEASISNNSARSRGGSESMDVTALLGLDSLVSDILPNNATLNPAIGTNSSSSSEGDGSTNRNEEITLRVAATVVDVLPNGHLIIQGSQESRVNFELRDLQMKGIVRPEDISRRNTISYDKIAEARIVYGGRGHITDMQQPRYGQQIIDLVVPF